MRERLNVEMHTADMAMVKLAGPSVRKEIEELISAKGRTGYKKVNESFFLLNPKSLIALD